VVEDGTKKRRRCRRKEEEEKKKKEKKKRGCEADQEYLTHHAPLSPLSLLLLHS
jgi:hypothetical protein